MGRSLKPLRPTLPPERAAFVEALRQARGTMTLTTIAERSGISPPHIGRFFRGELVPTLPLAQAVALVCGVEWEEIKPLWQAARITVAALDGVKTGADHRTILLTARLDRAERRIHELAEILTKLLDDKEGHEMSTKNGYILIHRYPGGEIKAHDAEFDTFPRAVRAAGLWLESVTEVSKAAVERFTQAMMLATLRTHRSGHAFRILRADHTADGHAIVPGLRVVTNDLDWGTVEENQFMAHGELDPGGEHFNHWYLVRRESDGYTTQFNGERLGVRMPKGLRST